MTDDKRLSGFLRVVRLAGMALVLATLFTGGCMQMMIADMVMDTDTEVSVTVTANHDLDVDTLVGELSRQFGVVAAIQAIHTGAAVLKIVGTYAAVLESLQWMTGLGLELLANDAVSEALLEVAFYALK